MGLRLKFNIVLTVVFAAGMAVSAWVSYRLLQNNAKQEVLRNAGLMMEARSPSAATRSRR
jgi:protein-histidine pros-kinase